MTFELIIKNGITFIDEEDLPLVSGHNWRVSAKGYVIDYKRIDGKTKVIFMHRLILGLPEKYPLVDHINHNPLDNTRINLRTATYSENARNTTARGKSKYLGVSFQLCKYKDKIYPPYIKAKIRINGKNFHIGTFKTEIEAARAYNEVAKKHHGEFANLNVL
jgi:hypothetical protein